MCLFCGSPYHHAYSSFCVARLLIRLHSSYEDFYLVLHPLRRVGSALSLDFHTQTPPKVQMLSASDVSHVLNVLIV